MFLFWCIGTRKSILMSVFLKNTSPAALFSKCTNQVDKWVTLDARVHLLPVSHGTETFIKAAFNSVSPPT